MRDAALDLLLGGRCVGCRRPGRALCPDCRADLPGQPRVCWPEPPPEGLATPWSVADYDGVVRSMVIALKERGVLGLAVPLGDLLGVALTGAVTATGDPSGEVLLVPVPSRPGTVRARGHDPLLAVVRQAAHHLPRARVARLLASHRGVRDQAGLGAADRAANLAGSMWCPSRGLHRLAGVRARVVLCDDVLTTGATAREAQRALAASGLSVAAVATVAATRRRTGRPAHGQSSGARLSSPPPGG